MEEAAEVLGEKEPGVGGKGEMAHREVFKLSTGERVPKSLDVATERSRLAAMVRLLQTFFIFEESFFGVKVGRQCFPH
ncbi:MAG: hypothetical protein AABZ10_11860 [Nitrospirota bacterium]